MPWVLLSALLHVGAVVVYFIVSAARPSFLDDHQVIEVRIVQKGKPRDEKLLPRQVEEAPRVEAPTPVEKEAEPAPPPVTKPMPEKHAIVEPKAKTAEKSDKPPRKNPLDALQKRLKSIEKEGKEEGMDYGNSLTGELTDAYQARVYSMLKATYDTPMLSERDKRTLIMKMNIRFDENGKPTVKVTQPSRNPSFDNAVVVNARNIESFGPPPLPIRKKMKQEGIEIEWCPDKCPNQD